MYCPRCKDKLKCYYTSKPNKNTIDRKYVCMYCERRYISIETLEPTPCKNIGVPNFLRRYYDERNGIRQKVHSGNAK